MSESKMTELFSFILTLVGAILYFTSDEEKSKIFGIVLAALGIFCIIIIAPIFRAKELAAKQKENHQKEPKKCPECGKKMEEEWEICPYCQTDLNVCLEDDSQ
ncbi:MAG: zinc ribbon domain-containing protein [Ruminococcaceae bacterium]|nr:zinc ribbon domain-containing protein [Oscillospiraceae bacterium]